MLDLISFYITDHEYYLKQVLPILTSSLDITKQNMILKLSLK